jgi:hypothetical protein
MKAKVLIGLPPDLMDERNELFDLGARCLVVGSQLGSLTLQGNYQGQQAIQRR